MTLNAIHQFIPCLVSGDAIGSHTLQVRTLLHDIGLKSDTYIGAVGPDVPIPTIQYEKYPPKRSSSDKPGDTMLLYHSSTGCPMAGFLAKRPEPLLVNYHNITPSADFQVWNRQAAKTMEEGREELKILARTAVHGIGDSRYNEEELIAAGYRSTSVAPILFDPATFDRRVDIPTLDWLRRQKQKGGANILFVGRLAPNKAQHDVITAFAAYRRLYDSKARLYLVGGSPIPEYLPTLRRLALGLGLMDAIDFAGFVSDEQLAAYYKGADVFLCLSDHEGFCVPLLEAMFNKVPIIAYSAAAVPETLADGGLLLSNKRAGYVAAAVDRVIRDDSLRQSLVDAGTARLADFELERSRKAYRSGIELALEQVG